MNRLTKIVSLLLLLIALAILAACVATPPPTQPSVSQVTASPPAAETPTDTPEPSPTVPLTVTELLTTELQAAVVAGLPPTATPDASGYAAGITGVNVIPLEVAEDEPPLWAVFSTGMRNFDPLEKHFVALYTHNDAGWEELARLDLEDPDYLFEEAVTQEAIEPTHTWLSLAGGAGAHGAVYYLLSFDGTTLETQASLFSDGSGTGQVIDLNGDGQLDVVLDQGNAYVFCYACGVRSPAFQVLTWDGYALTDVSLAPLPDSAPAELRDLNNRAVELGQAGLWKQAQATISQTQEISGADTTVAWNAALIKLNDEAHTTHIASSAYPLLSNVFYGDYDAALELMRPYTPTVIFDPAGPLVVGTPAEGWLDSLAQWVNESATAALAVEPELAGAYFLRGWSAYLLDPTNPNALADIQQAAELAPDEPLFTASVEHLQP
jgi:hypothetical protein